MVKKSKNIISTEKENLNTLAHSKKLSVYRFSEGDEKFFKASDVQKFALEAKSKEEKIVKAVMSWTIKSATYDYFKKELWKRVKGFKSSELDVILAAFVSSSLEEIGVYAQPCGVECVTFDWSKEAIDEYLKPYRPLFRDFNRWYMKEYR